MTTGEKIKELRVQKGYSQEKLGELVGLQKAAIHKYESGRVVNIKRTVLAQLAKALDVTPADLLDDNEETSALELLDGQEKKIIEAYRKLPEQKRQALYNFIKTIAE